MKPLKFEGSKELKKPDSMTDEECSSLWILRQDNYCISLWTTTFWKRLKFLFHGHIWIWILSGQTQPPMILDCKDDLYKEDKPIKEKIRAAYYWILLKIKRLEK